MRLAGEYEQARAQYSQAIALSEGSADSALGKEECAVFYANRASALLMLVTTRLASPPVRSPRTRTVCLVCTSCVVCAVVKSMCGQPFRAGAIGRVARSRLVRCAQAKVDSALEDCITALRLAPK